MVEEKLERIRLKKEQRKELKKEQERLARKAERQEKKLRKQKKLHREMNAPNSKKERSDGDKKLEDHHSGMQKVKKNNKKEEPEEQTAALALFKKAYGGGVSDADGMATLRLGVKYQDVVVGKGPVAQDGMLLTVKYVLTGGKFGATIDSSKNFKFRLGKGEVIQGWEIGMAGMRQGGRRKLVIPPKAGYGSQDIGAGSGALLYFDVTLLACS